MRQGKSTVRRYGNVAGLGPPSPDLRQQSNPGLRRQFGPIAPQAPPFPLATAASTPLRRAAEAAGSDDWTPLWAGQHVPADGDLAAADMVRRLAAGLA